MSRRPSFVRAVRRGGSVRGVAVGALVAAGWLAVTPDTGAIELTPLGNTLIRSPYTDEATGFGMGIAVGDFDADNVDDLVIAEHFGTRMRVHFGADWVVGNTVPPVATGITFTVPQFGGIFAVGDFDDDGVDDLVLGAPGDTSGTGAVFVMKLVAGEWQLDETIRQEGPYPGAGQAGTQLGYSLAVGDFDRDSYDDLAIGIPYKTVDGADDAGAVMIVYGSDTGLGPERAEVFHRGNDGLTFVPTEDDYYGFSVAAGDFDGDFVDDLAIGVPGAACPNGTDRAGAVVTMRGVDDVGITNATTRVFRPGTLGVAGTCAGTETFGYSLVTGGFDTGENADLAIGAPDTGTNGAVHVLFGANAGLSTDGDLRLVLPAIPNSTPLASLFGLSLAAGRMRACSFCQAESLVVGAPLADVEGVFNAGAVVVFHASGQEPMAQSNHRVITANTLASGPPNPDDYFGFSVALGDFNDDSSYQDLVIGVPYFDRGGVENGAVQLIFQDPESLFGNGFE